ncbi:MAG TPA: PQQ-binding-like beta-propeller repeat protein [Gemmatimonadaceae bacterium]|nr:PQQ-binding-like beta-propeller repeat protein [Gemmatimonadaceae bacterium]
MTLSSSKAPLWIPLVAATLVSGDAATPRVARSPDVAERALVAPMPASAGAPSKVAMFRGDPARTGRYSGGGPSLIGMAWRAPTGGDVISSPAIDGGVVYVGSNDGYLYAFDLTTGARRWRANLESAVASSPAIAGGLVFVASRDGSVFAVDAASGARRWRMATRALLPLPWGHESGDYYLSSPAYVDGTLVFGAGDGAVYAVDAASGRVRWRAQTEGRIRSSPAVDGGRVYVGSYDGRVYCFDLASGTQRWRFDTDGASLQSGKYGFDRRSIQSSPAVAGGVVYVGARDGFLYAIDATSGALKWRFDHHISWVITSPAVADGIVYAGSSDAAFVQAIDATGKELWRTTGDAIVWASPSVAGDLVYVGDGAGRLRALDRSSGAVKWEFRTGASIYASPGVSGDYVVVGSSDGGVYALRATAGPPITRAVFFDSVAVKMAHVAHPEAAARYFVNRGYRALDTASLATFLAERVADRAPSVVVFAMDYAPASIVSPAPATSLLRRYLEAGGTIIWPGVPPGIFPAVMPPGELRLDWGAAHALTGVPHDSALFDSHGVHATAEGTRCGLSERWRDAWSVAPGGVTSVLGVDDGGLAAAWVRGFGGPAGTGFVRVPNDDLLAIYLAAECRPAAPLEPQPKS